MHFPTLTMTNKDIVKHIVSAIALVKAEERPLQSDVHERSVAHRLAVHMEDLFPGWDVDCEYNKHYMLHKTLEGIKECDKQRKTNRIFPDIIVHKRTNGSHVEENLLVIEMKRDDECDLCDKMKLELFTKSDGQYKYQLGLYIDIRGGQFARTWYRNGVSVDIDALLNE